MTYIEIKEREPTKACTIEVYGVNFDFNKSTLRPESEPVLTQLAGMFAADPSYAGEISGHTDDQGADAYNQQLSQKRAKAVGQYLVTKGVAASRHHVARD